MKTLITFANLTIFDGAYSRLATLKKHWKPDSILSISFDKDVTSNQICENGCDLLSLEKKFRKWTFIKAFFAERSFLSARLPSLSSKQLKILDNSSEIFVHTSRVLNKIPRRFHHKIRKIDLCDDLIFTFVRSACHYLLQLKLFLGTIYLWEAFIEWYNIKKFNYVSFSLISTPLKKRFYNFEVFPNLVPSISTISYHEIQHPIRYGIIGNFRTVANVEVIDAALENLNIQAQNITVFGINSLDMLEKYDQLNCFGTFSELSDISEEFDVGLCLVQTQGGFQNKVLDYLLLGKVAVINDHVYESIQKDPYYSILLSSPFILRDSNFTPERVLHLFTEQNFILNKSILHQKFVNDD